MKQLWAEAEPPLCPHVPSCPSVIKGAALCCRGSSQKLLHLVGFSLVQLFFFSFFFWIKNQPIRGSCWSLAPLGFPRPVTLGVVTHVSSFLWRFVPSPTRGCYPSPGGCEAPKPAPGEVVGGTPPSAKLIGGASPSAPVPRNESVQGEEAVGTRHSQRSQPRHLRSLYTGMIQ